MKKALLSILGAVLVGTMALAGCAETQPGENPLLKISDLNWGSAHFQSEMAKIIIEEGYDYPVELVPGATIPLFQGLRTGDIDVFLEGWLQNQIEAYDAAMAAGDIVLLGFLNNDNWQSCFVVPTYVITGDEVEDGLIEPLSDEALLGKIQEIQPRVQALRQYMVDTKNPVCVISVDKKKSQQKLIKKLEVLKSHIKVLIIVDTINNDINDPYMLIWRVVNNIDASRDVVLEPFIALDATNKGEVDGFIREWPGDTFCTKEVLDMLQEKGLINIDDAFIRKFGLLPF